MRVAITATAPSLNAAIDPRFGRCACFLLVDTDSMRFESFDNTADARGCGAGIQAAQRMAQQGASAVITGNCGPNAYQTLTAAGIEVFTGCSGTVAEAVGRFASGQLRAASASNVASHAGIGGGPR
jgi:predicted Fe-Mo cluster-binding NifX family protein